jgi:outer membrane protein TolC
MKSLSLRKLTAHVAFSVLPLTLLAGCSLSPEPLDKTAAAMEVDAKLESTYAEQAPVSRRIDLSEAMARAVLYNLDHRVEMLDAALKARDVESASIGMLPSLVAGAGYSGRNNFEASSSRSLSTGLESLETSTSQDRSIRTQDLALSWNVLDFGLSYVRAKQAADRQLIAEEMRRKTMSRIVEEVRSTYWRALAASALSQDLRVLQKRVKTALEKAEQLARGGQAGKLVALTYQRDLYELSDRILQAQTEVVSARKQLAGLMNLRPGTPFTLVRPDTSYPAAPSSDMTVLVRSALESRAEMASVLYDQRIGSLDGTAALLEILPGINLSAGQNKTSNSFTANPDWFNMGARTSLNLMKLATYPVRQGQLDAQSDLAEARVKATAGAIALQVYLSRERYLHAVERSKSLANYSGAQQQLLKQMSATNSAEKSGEIELVREELTALLARTRRDIAYAEVQSAYAAFQTTLGRDPYPQIATTDVQQLAAGFRLMAKGRTAAISTAGKS